VREDGVDGASVEMGCGKEGADELPEIEHGVATATAGAGAAAAAD
jgi:hypothetical protein